MNNPPSDPLGRLIRFVVRFVFVAAGAVFFLSLRLAGVIAGVAFTRGSVRRERARAGGFGTRWRSGCMAAEAGDVVEVQAREVVRADQRLGGSRG